MALASFTPVQPNPVGAFLWGDNGTQLTPEQAAAQQQVANAIILNSPAPQNVGEGLNAVGRALVASKYATQAGQAIQSGRQQATSDLQTVLADPTKAASFLANDPYASDGQKQVAQAILQQQMMLTNPDMIAQRNLIASEVAKNTAEANMMKGGGTAVGSPIQDANGNYYIPTQYGSTMRPLNTAPSGGGSPNAPATVSPQPVDGSAPVAPAMGAPTGAAPTGANGGPQFLTPAQQEQLKAKAQAQGTYEGGLEQNQQKAAQALEEQAIINDNLLGSLDPKTGQRSGGLIDQAIAAASKPAATGIGGQLTEGISGTPAANLNELLKNIDANAAQKGIQDFRDSTPAGATGMRITQAEALLFGKTLSNISPHQSREQLVQQLATLKKQLTDISGSMQDSYARMYGGLKPVQTHRVDAFPQGYALPFDQGGTAAPATAAPATASPFAEGATATNPQTGAKIVFRGGQWVPLQ